MDISPERAVRTMGPEHPVSRSMMVLRAWLTMIVVVMTWNGVVANGILLDGPFRPLPWFALAVCGVIWAWCPWRGILVILCSSLMTVGCILRALEILLFADQYTDRGRLTGLSIYILIGGTALLIGFLNIVVTSRKTAEEWVWERRS